MKHKIYVLLAIVAALIVLERLHEFYNDGFFKSRIVSEAFLPQVQTTLSSSDEAFLEPLLREPFHYVSKGRQAYVFATADDRYVIKFFKVRSIALEPWTENLPELFLTNSRERKAVRYNELCLSYHLAYEELPAETDVLFLHLDKAPRINKTITVHDRLGAAYTINLDETQFIIQKKVTVLKEALLNLLARGQRTEAIALSQKVVAALQSLGERGIACPDPNFLNNIGVRDEEIVFLDPGRLVKDERIKDFAYRTAFIHRYMYEWREWMVKHGFSADLLP